MSIFDKISSLITGSKPEKRESEKVSSSSAEKPVEIVKKPARPAPIIEKKPQRVIVVQPVREEPKTVSIKRAVPESVAHYPTKADICGNIPLDKSNYSRYRKATIMLPEFDFYTGRNCDVYDENSVEAQTIKELDQWAAAKQGEALALEEGREYDKAAAIYEELIHHRYWDTEPYHRLYNIYRKAGLTREATNLSQMAAAHFRRISQEQKRQLQNLADRYKSRAYTEKIIGALAYSSSVKPLTKNLSLTINDLCFLYSRSSPVSKKRWKYISANCMNE